MKFLIAIISLMTISSTLFAVESVVTSTQVCGKPMGTNFENCYSVSHDDEGSPVYEFKIIAANTSLNITSNEIYDGVDSSALNIGLQKIGDEGMSADMAAFIAGPVVSKMKAAIINPTSDSAAALVGIKLRLAKRIAKQ